MRFKFSVDIKKIWMKDKGFTLIELIVVIAIIGILAAIIAPNAFKAIEKAKVAKAVSDFKTIKTATYALYADTGQWPSSSGQDLFVANSDLLNNVHSWSGWDGPYLEKSPDPHPWAGRYMFEGQDNYGGGLSNELILEFEDYCHPSGPNSPKCAVPRNSARKIDEKVDDGDLSTGDIRQGSAGGDMGWVLIWDPW